MMRHDVSVSIGSLGTHVRFYRHDNYIPELTLDVTVYRVPVGTDIRRRINTSSYTDFMKLSSHAVAFDYPAVVEQRGATAFCRCNLLSPSRISLPSLSTRHRNLFWEKELYAIR